MASRPERPRVRLVLAMSLDGYIADAHGRTDFVGREDRRELFRLRAQADAVLVGARTVLQDELGLSLPARLQRWRIGCGKPPLPIRAVVSGSLSIAKARRLFRVHGDLTWVFTTSGKQVRNAFVVQEREPLRMADVLEDLYTARARLVQVEGGARLAESFLREGLVDEWALTICPQVLGSGIRLPFPRTMHFRTRSADCLGRDVRLWLERDR